MQSWQMKVKFINSLKKFGYETFRPRTGADYAEIFTRGGGGEDVPYPWFYSRVILGGLFLFSLLCIGYKISEINFPAVSFAGGIFADLAFIILLFEIYPKRDFPLIAPLAALFAGGLLSSAFSYILYGLSGVTADFASQAWTAFVEEFSKSVTVVIILLLFKKRNAFQCFIIGAAVGGGFSAFENVWYMYTDGFAYNFLGLSGAMCTALIRALGTPFSHAAWAGAFGWALSGEKPWKSLRPYAILFFNYVMHFFVNFPLTRLFAGWKGYPISAVTGILSFALIIRLIIINKRELCGRIPLDAEKQGNSCEHLPKIINPENEWIGINLSKNRFIANVLAACAVLSLTFTLMGPTCIFGGYEHYKYDSYNSFEEAASVAQNGLVFSPDFEREYVFNKNLTENFSFMYTNGNLEYVVQREQYGDYFYRFRYGYTRYPIYRRTENSYYVLAEGEEVLAYTNGQDSGDFHVVFNEETGLPAYARRWELQNIYLEYGDSQYPCITFYAQYEPLDGKRMRELRYFDINPYCISVYGTPDGKYNAIMAESVPVRKTEAIIFSGVFGAAFAGFGIAYIVEKIKIRRYKNVE